MPFVTSEGLDGYIASPVFVSEFIETFRAHCSEFLLHRYVCDWQDAYSEELIKRERPNHITIGWDFAMNYTCEPREELKAQFFSCEQCSLHTTIAYHEWPPSYEKECYPPLKGGKPQPRADKMMQTHIYLSRGGQNRCDGPLS